jgi:TRAP-type C4-dicarboxylate transport system permease small subunit
MGKKVWNFINNLDLYIGCTVLTIMVITMFSQVIARYVLDTSIVWSEALSRYSILWMTFVGLGYGIRHHSHLEMTIFYNACHPVVKKILQILINLIIIAAYCYIMPETFKFVLSQKNIIVTGMGVPFMYIYSILPPALIVMILRIVWDTVQVILDKDFGKEKKEG